MDVSVSELRRHLSDYIESAQRGEDVIVTERGVPVARLSGTESTPVIQRLIREGIVSPPVAKHRPDPDADFRVPATGSISEFITKQRR